MSKRYDAILLLGLKLNSDGTPKHELMLRIEKLPSAITQDLRRSSSPAAVRRRARRCLNPRSCSAS